MPSFMIEKTIAQILTKKKMTLSVAESCTGGLISDSLTNIPGSSKFFICGIIAYSNDTKIKLLGISPDIIRDHGAVSKETALALSENVKRIAHADIGIGVTGIAGPGGATPLKPIGVVFISVCLSRHCYFKKFNFSGTRTKIKRLAKDAALRMLKECLS